MINRENQNLRNFPRDAKHPRVNNMQRHSIVKQEKVTSETEQFPIAWINFVRFGCFKDERTPVNSTILFCEKCIDVLLKIRAGLRHCLR